MEILLRFSRIFSCVGTQKMEQFGSQDGRQRCCRSVRIQARSDLLQELVNFKGFVQKIGVISQ